LQAGVDFGEQYFPFGGDGVGVRGGGVGLGGTGAITGKENGGDGQQGEQFIFHKSPALKVALQRFIIKKSMRREAWQGANPRLKWNSFVTIV
jgi:hypothetical protein